MVIPVEIQEILDDIIRKVVSTVEKTLDNINVTNEIGNNERYLQKFTNSYLKSYPETS